MYNFCIFAGTTEGRELAEFLSGQGDKASVTACVATEYGETLLTPAPGLRVLAGRLNEEQMVSLLKENDFDLVLDATHPYADVVTENVAAACRASGREYLRVLREDSAVPEGTVFLPDTASAVAWLSEHEGNILLTTGSKTLGEYTGIRDFAKRVWARVLPMGSSLVSCEAAGLPPAHIIAMQGPFTQELNIATLKAIGADYLVTKDSGGTGGFREKAAAATAAGAKLIVLGRPPQLEGLSLSETVDTLCSRFGLRREQQVTVVGIGPGSREQMTLAVREAIENADCLIGAKRMLEAVARQGQAAYGAIAPDAIAECIRAHGEYRRFAVVMSGDSGFFSGTKKLLPLLDFCRVTVLPGLSSLSCLCAKLGTSYEDVVTVSLHGREHDIASDVRRHGRVFALVGGDNGAGVLCERLREAGLGHVTVHVGEKLSYPEEKLTSGSASELAEKHFDSLSAVLIENESPDAVLTPGLPDGVFQREETVPMTKSEVRSVSLSKLRLTENAVCWDVGAGTGSVALEMAMIARKGHVYGIERKADALELMRSNAARLGVENLTAVSGKAPDACRELPAPTHAFIGGSGGNLREIIALLLEKNPRVRIVVTAVTLETVGETTALMKEFPFTETEVVSLSVARDRKAGPYRLMTGLNPVFIFTMQAGGETA
ncbi:MAG: precorrin-6A reductase [Oscillospiraceae bacterium]|nr:precorrin-6A reductase [Oscillospiraceae bacterium]